MTVAVKREICPSAHAGGAISGGSRIEGMKDQGTSAAIVVALFILGLLGTTYVAGYFWLGEYDVASWSMRRGYQHKLVSELYKPLAWIEGKLRGKAVETWWMNEPDSP